MYRSMNPDELDYQYSCRKWSIKPMEAEQVIDDFMRVMKAATEKARIKVPHELDIRYGEGENQKLDIYGTDLPSNSDILVFVHGGYWQAQSKEDSAAIVEPMYRRGIRVIIADYDLAPKVTVRTIVGEISELLSYTLNMAEKNNSSGVWLVGHSAGAHLISWFLNPNNLRAFPEQQKNLLKGMTLISGVFDILPLIWTHVNEGAKLDEEEARKLSTNTFFECRNTMKVAIFVGEHESPEFIRQSEDAYESSRNVGNEAEFIVTPDVDHFSIVEKLSNSEFEVNQLIFKMMGSE